MPCLNLNNSTAHCVLYVGEGTEMRYLTDQLLDQSIYKLWRLSFDIIYYNTAAASLLCVNAAPPYKHIQYTHTEEVSAFLLPCLCLVC